MINPVTIKIATSLVILVGIAFDTAMKYKRLQRENNADTSNTIRTGSEQSHT